MTERKTCLVCGFLTIEGRELARPDRTKLSEYKESQAIPADLEQTQCDKQHWVLRDFQGILMEVNRSRKRCPGFTRYVEGKTPNQHLEIQLERRKVFIVHGRDHQTLGKVKGLIERLNLEPVVLSDEPMKGRAIIEKLSQVSKVSAAVVLLTPCDTGCGAGEDLLRPRARQNVIFELGYFISHLGRHNVIILYVDGVEIPTNVSGVGYIRLGEKRWKHLVAKELQAAGLDGDFGKLLTKKPKPRRRIAAGPEAGGDAHQGGAAGAFPEVVDQLDGKLLEAQDEPGKMAEGGRDGRPERFGRVSADGFGELFPEAAGARTNEEQV